MLESKNNLRKLFKEYRRGYTDSQWDIISNRIQVQVIDLIKSMPVNSLACYLQSKKTREIATNHILEALFDLGIDAFVPVVGENFSMKMVQVSESTRYILNNWGIPEPAVSNEPDQINEPEVVLVPMLGADYHLYRIGYGKGYYDRYLNKKKVIKIGLCPQSCVIHSLPVDQYDIPMDYLITEYGILRINEN